MSHLKTFACIAMLLFFTTSAYAQLFFSEDNNSSGLYVIDITTGAATNIGTSGVTAATNGLAPSDNPNQLFGSEPFGLLRVAIDGSGETIIGGDTQEGLAFDPNTGTVYGALNGVFSTIDPTTGLNTATLSPPGQDVEGMAWGDGGVYALPSTDNADLLFYNPANDSWSVIGNTGISWDSTGLAFDPSTRTLFALGDQDSNLYRINPDTAATTVIGNTGIAAGGGLAFIGSALPESVPVPVNSMTGLIVLTLSMLLIGWIATRMRVGRT